MPTTLQRTDPSGFYTFMAILSEARRRGYGDRSFEIARGVYLKRTGEVCPFEDSNPTLKAPEALEVIAPKVSKLPAAPATLVATIDFETRSRCDLKAHGASVYAEHESTQVLCLGFAIGEDEHLWEPSQGLECPAPLAAHIAAGGLVEAHNAEFEQAIWHYICVKRLGWPVIGIDRWRDSMALCAAIAIPQSLGNATAALGSKEQKDAEGARVMMRLCKPRRPSKNNPAEWHEDPEDYRKLYAYCLQDVRAERGLSHQLPPLSKQEERVWWAHNRTNRRGIHADRVGIEAALRMLALASTHIGDQVTKATGGLITGDELAKREKVLTWCRSRGVSLAAYTKADVAEALSVDLPEDVRVVLEARRSLGRTSTAKFQAMLNRMNADGRIRGTLNYHGAATGRWAGRGIQPQNFPREGVKDVDACLADMATLDAEAFTAKHGDPFKAAVGCLRGCLDAAPGQVLIAADYSAIEARVLLWVASDPGVRIFRDYDAGRGPDIYRVMAADIYHKPGDAITKEERQLGKIAVLGLGYGMGAPKFHATCAAQGSPVDELFAEQVVQKYRGRFPRVKAFWYAVEDAAVQAVNAGPDAPAQVLHPVRFKMLGPHLYCRLPSGRRLCYPFAELRPRPTPWGEERLCVTFMGEDSLSRQWVRQDTYGGKLTENIVQAVARDLMAGALVRAEEQGWRPVLTVHDELVAEIPEARASDATVSEFEALLCELPAWADGLPVAAEGWCDRRYRK